MMRDFKHKILTTILLLAILSVASMYTTLLPTAQAAEPTLQEKSLSILSDVVGLKTEHYTITRSVQHDTKNLDAPQKQLDLNLATAESSVRVTCVYTRDTLQLVYLSDMEGRLETKTPAVNNTVDMAKDLLSNYLRDFGNPVYEEFAAMLNTVKEGENAVKVDGDVKLEVTTPQQNTTSYMWTYIDGNGVVAERKNVCLTYEHGMFKAFYNNWELYTIAETEPKFSAEQATAMAIEASKNFSYTVTDVNGTEKTVSGFSIAPESLDYAKLIYVNSKEQTFARGGDPYRMYLAWFVPLGFDKFYPGDVSGLTVILWADTGEVCGMDRVIIDSDFVSSVANDTADVDAEHPISTPTNEQVVSMPSQALGISAAIGMVAFSLGTCKSVKLAGGKRRLSKSWAIMLCMLVLFSVLFFVVPKASATTLGGNSRTYAIPNAMGPLGYENEGADIAERDASLGICSNITQTANDYGYNGRSTYDVAIKQNVLSTITSDENNYAGTMLFHIGHQAGFGTYEDNVGAQISPGDILPRTTLGKHYFVFLWVCVQVSTNYSAPGADSMAAAWLHRDGSAGHPLLDADGFGANSDGWGQCFIGFYGFSPMVSNYPNSCYPQAFNGTFYEFSTLGSVGPCSRFITDFYHYALVDDMPVYDALNFASWNYFGCPYSSCVLNTGYNGWWPGGNWPAKPWLIDPGYWPIDFRNRPGVDEDTKSRGPNRMRVLGDSTIKLTHSYVTLAARDNYNNPISTTLITDGQETSLGSHYMLNRP